MSDSFGHRTPGAHRRPTQNVGRIVGIGTGLVALNIVLMFALSYTPIASIGAALFSNFFVGIVAFVATVGGGFWIANKGLESDNMGITSAGVTLIQFGYGMFGAAILASAGTELRVTALGITTVVTAAITAAVVLVVFRTDRSFAGWNRYGFGCFIGGFVVGAIAFFVAPPLLLFAGLLFFLGFVAHLTYEIWAVRENRFASDLRSGIGIYVAVMGVFVHVLQWVMRILAMMEE